MNTSINSSENDLTLIRQLIREELRNELLAQSTPRNNGNGSALEANPITDRRGMLKTVAGLAVGVATVGLLRPSSSSAAARAKGPDATGGNMIIGFYNFCSAAADVTAVANPSSVIFPVLLLGDNYNSNAFSAPANHYISVCGHVDNQGATPTTGKFIGVWGEAKTPAGGNAVGMVAAAGVAVTVDQLPAKQLGDSPETLPTYNVGMYAEASAGGDGLFAVSNGGAFSYAVHGESDLGYGGVFGGGTAAVLMEVGTGAIANPNVTPPGGTGEFYRGSTLGSVWYNAGGTNPYRRIADNTTAGALTLQTPMRLVDTRTGSGFPGAGMHFGSDDLRTFNVITLATPDLPVGTRGVIGRISVVNATASGGLQQSPNGPPGAGNDLGFGTAVLTYPSGATIPAFGGGFITGLDTSGNIRIHNIMSAGNTADVIIDITGYFL